MDIIALFIVNKLLVKQLFKQMEFFMKKISTLSFCLVLLVSTSFANSIKKLDCDIAGCEQRARQQGVSVFKVGTTHYSKGLVTNSNAIICCSLNDYPKSTPRSGAPYELPKGSCIEVTPHQVSSIEVICVPGGRNEF